MNRWFNKMKKLGLFDDIFNDILYKYSSSNPIKELHIDSTDIINKNCTKDIVGYSRKFHKNGLKLTLVEDQNKIPIMYSYDNPTIYDSIAGYELLVTFENESNEIIKVGGDKGYILDENDDKTLFAINKLKMINPKKKYKKRKYKTKNYKSKIKRIRHSKYDKEIIKNRIHIEHTNSIIHRSYKKIDQLYDRNINTLNAYMKLTITIMIIKFNITNK